MKSTIKIDYASSGTGGAPIIKIIRPKEVLEIQEFTDGDYDVRDKLINDFIQTPGNVDYNSLFTIRTYGSLEKAPGCHVATIAPLDITSQFNAFRHNIINRLVPYDTIVAINRGEVDIEKYYDMEIPPYKYKKITEFFDWLDNQEWVSNFEDSQLLHNPQVKTTYTIRHIFESLPQDARMAAFGMVKDKTLLERCADSLSSAISIACYAYPAETNFDVAYWNDLIKEYDSMDLSEWVIKMN